jgi:hypothetical protein
LTKSGTAMEEKVVEYLSPCLCKDLIDIILDYSQGIFEYQTQVKKQLNQHLPKDLSNIVFDNLQEIFTISCHVPDSILNLFKTIKLTFMVIKSISTCKNIRKLLLRVIKNEESGGYYAIDSLHIVHACFDQAAELWDNYFVFLFASDQELTIITEDNANQQFYSSEYLCRYNGFNYLYSRNSIFTIPDREDHERLNQFLESPFKGDENYIPDIFMDSNLQFESNSSSNLLDFLSSLCF